MSENQICKHCGLPIFHGVVSTTLSQCKCQWTTKYPEHAIGKLSYEPLEYLNAALRDKCAELEKDVQVAKGQYEGACDIIAELQRKLDGYEQAAKQEPRAWWDCDEYGALIFAESVLHKERLEKDGRAMRPLYDLPPNIPALIEQAKAEEMESALKVMRHAAAALAHAAESNPLYQDAYNEIDAAIRERKP